MTAPLYAQVHCSSDQCMHHTCPTLRRGWPQVPGQGVPAPPCSQVACCSKGKCPTLIMDMNTLAGLLLRRLHPYLQPASASVSGALPLALSVLNESYDSTSCYHTRQAGVRNGVGAPVGRPGKPVPVLPCTQTLRQHSKADNIWHANKWLDHLRSRHSRQFTSNACSCTDMLAVGSISPCHGCNSQRNTERRTQAQQLAAGMPWTRSSSSSGRTGGCEPSSFGASYHRHMRSTSTNHQLSNLDRQIRGLHGSPVCASTMSVIVEEREDDEKAEFATSSDEQIAPKKHLFISQHERQRTPATSTTWKDARPRFQQLQPGALAGPRMIAFPNITLQMMKLPDDQLEQIKKYGWVREAAFRTTPNVTKLEIKVYLETVYGMNVERVSTINYLGKKYSTRPSSPRAEKRGFITAREDDWKKAYVIFKNPPAGMPPPPPPPAAAAQHQDLLKTVRGLQNQRATASPTSLRNKPMYIDTWSFDIIGAAPELKAFAERNNGQLPRALPVKGEATGQEPAAPGLVSAPTATEDQPTRE